MDSERFGLAVAISGGVIPPDCNPCDGGRAITLGRYQVGLLESFADSDPVWYTKEGASWRADMLSRQLAYAEIYPPAVGVWDIDKRMSLTFIYYDGMEFRP